MHLHRYFPCIDGCLGKTYIPLAIPTGISPDQIPWPTSLIEQTFLCLDCNRATSYTKSNLLLDSAPCTEDQCLSREMAVYRIAVPCGKDKCEGRIEIHVVMPKGAGIENAEDLAPKIYTEDIPCSTGEHRHTGRGISPRSMGFSIDRGWSGL